MTVLGASWRTCLSSARICLEPYLYPLACNEQESLFCAMLSLSFLTAAGGLSVAVLTKSAFLAGTVFGAGLLLAASWQYGTEGERVAPAEHDETCNETVAVAGEASQASLLLGKKLSIPPGRCPEEAGLACARGSSALYLPDGCKIRTFVDGRRIISRRFGHAVEMLKRENFDDGDSINLRYAHGVTVEVYADGTKITDNRSGGCVEERKDGTRLVYDPDYRLLGKSSLPPEAIEQNRKLFHKLNQICTGKPSSLFVPDLLKSELSCQETMPDCASREGNLDKYFLLLESFNLLN